MQSFGCICCSSFSLCCCMPPTAGTEGTLQLSLPLSTMHGSKSNNAALALPCNSHGLGKNQLAAANPTGKTWESWCQRHGAWERCRFGRQMVALLHNCAKYSSCDKTLQFMTGYLGQGLHFPESYLGA